MDGNVVKIVAKLETDELEDKLEEAYKELEKFRNEEKTLEQQKAKIEIEVDFKKEDLERKIREIQAKAEAQKIGLGTTRSEDRYKRDKIDAKAQAQINSLTEQYELYLKNANNSINDINQALENNTSTQSTLNKEIEVMNDELDKRDWVQNFNDSVNGMQNKSRDLKDTLKDALTPDFKTLNKKIDGVGKSIRGITRKVIKWGLAVFSIRSAYNFVRSSISQITQDNEELANKLAVIKGALASAIEPIVTRIINLVYTLMSYINTLVSKITGKDLFAKAKDNLAKGSKSAKEINKQMASFDEQNVLSDNSSGGDATAGLDNLDEGLISVLDKFKELFSEGNFGAIAEILSAKLVEALNNFADAIANVDWASIGQGISDFLTHIDFSGILVGLARVFGEAVLGFQDLMLNIDWPKIFRNLSTGIAKAIFKIDEYIKKIKWDKIGTMISDTFTSIDWAGLGNSIITTIWDAISGLGTMLLNIDWGKVGETISTAVHEWITTIVILFEETDWMKLGEDIVDAIFDFIESVDWVQLAEDIMNGLFNGIVGLIEFVVGAFSKLIDRILELFGINSPSKVFADIGEDIMQGLINGIKAMVDFVLNIFRGIWDSIVTIFSVVTTWFKNKFTDAWNGIKSVFSGVGNFFAGIWNTIKSKFTEIGTKAGEVVGGAFKSVVNGILWAIEKILNTPIRAINGLIDVINTIPGVSVNGLQEFSLPRLAKGGIINQPNKGVMVGSAIAGESGREGILPLTDSQAMEQLGEAIGRYITINANITNTMNGRVISRELQKINNENDFAYNR